MTLSEFGNPSSPTPIQARVVAGTALHAPPPQAVTVPPQAPAPAPASAPLAAATQWVTAPRPPSAAELERTASDSLMAQLLEMGFDADAATGALDDFGGEFEEALQFLVANPKFYSRRAQVTSPPKPSHPQVHFPL